jgi:hypothetical protein
MLKKLTFVLALLLIYTSSSIAQWNNVGGTWAWTDVNPDTLTGQIHGMATDPDGKTWVQVWLADDVEVAHWRHSLWRICNKSFQR